MMVAIVRSMGGSNGGLMSVGKVSNILDTIRGLLRILELVRSQSEQATY